MRQKFEELRENLDEFVQQTDYSMLVLGCVPEEVTYAVTCLKGIDETLPESYFLIFCENFAAPAPYLDAVVLALSRQINDAEGVRKERGEPPFPPVPPELGDVKLAPKERLLRLLQFLPSLLPNTADYSLVVGFLPLAIEDNDAYCKLMASILPVPDVPPWMLPLRIVLSDDRREHQLMSLLKSQRAQNVLTYEIDFSTPALTAALSSEAANPSVPLAQRMASLLQLAALDFSYKRYPDALEKYGVLYAFYADPPLPAMQVLCLQGSGDVLHAAGKPAEAKKALQSGIALALEHKALGPLLMSLLSILNVCETLGDHADAESYAESGKKTAEASMNAPVYVVFVEKKADAQAAQAKREDAIATYQKCRELAELYEQFPVWKSVLGKLAKLHAEAGNERERKACEDDLLRVDAVQAARAAGVRPDPKPALRPAQPEGSA